MVLQESGEMYLETILILSQKNPNVRSIDIVDYMGYSKPSVSRAVKLLKEGGFIKVNADGYITLTDDGKSVANKMYERHVWVSQLLVGFGVDEETAAVDACKIEHVISDKTFEAIKKYVENSKK